VFPVALPTIIFGADPSVFLGIFRQEPLKSWSLFSIDYVKYLKRNRKDVPTYPVFFDKQQETVFFMALRYISKLSQMLN